MPRPKRKPKPKAKQRGGEPAPGDWKYVVGALTAFERKDRGNAIWTRVYDAASRGYTDKKPLHDGIRDANGKIVPELEQAARQAAIDREASASLGIEDIGVAGEPLTIVQGLRRVLHEKDGKYAGDTRWKNDVAGYHAVLLELIDGNGLWSALKPAHYRAIWRAMAHEHARTGRFGVRYAEMVLGALQSAARWLQEEELIDEGEGIPSPRWKSKLRAEWADITKKPIPRSRKLRYTPGEKERLFAHLYDEAVDPRLALAVEIGAELRLGQVARSRRSDVLEYAGIPCGAVEVHGRGKKLGELVALTEDQQQALAFALADGFLADLEAAYQAGETSDYYLIPGGHLRTVTIGERKVRRATVAGAAQPLGRRALNARWVELETIAGVEHVEGRGWYGMRRRQADDAEDVVSDERVLNKLGAWSDSKTRRGYQQEGRPEDLEETKLARALIRPKSSRNTDLQRKTEGE